MHTFALVDHVALAPSFDQRVAFTLLGFGELAPASRAAHDEKVAVAGGVATTKGKG